jgi:hypothetical protein
VFRLGLYIYGIYTRKIYKEYDVEVTELSTNKQDTLSNIYKEYILGYMYKV